MGIDNLDFEIEIAIKAAKSSGQLLVDSKSKLNNEISTDLRDTKLKADIASENLIKEYISQHSSHPIIAEESGKSKDNLGDTYWIVDPLDGTANYNRGIPICCVSIGLVHKMKPVAGVIYDFNNNDLYVGNNIKKIAILNDKKIYVSKINKKKDGILITGLPHNTNYSDEALTNMIKDMKSWKKLRMLGSAAMASCYIACGKADLYKENGVYIWDIIAGAAIIESAGGLAEIFNIQDNHQADVIFSNSKI
tara:strand:- start:45 stop:794 length:750 start_codon:yes stop_codon:yes gene_type:complete